MSDVKMWWSRVVLVFVFFAAVTFANSEESSQKVGEVYFIDNIHEGKKKPFSDDKVATHGPTGTLLGKPIADGDALPDGIYFRPEKQGKSLEGQVSFGLDLSALCSLYLINFIVYLSTY